MSSLELVLDNLINSQNRPKWQEFMKTWRGSLQAECENAYSRCAIYQQRRWPFTEFFDHLGMGSFPLHPLTAYLLCNLDLMQGRTAIQFVKENVRHYIDTQPAEKRGFLNFVRPVELVQAFRSNLSNHPLYPDYQKALTKIQASATEDDLKVLDALFLFYVSSGKLKKPDTEPHEHLLSMLCGMTPDQTREGLRRLTDQLGVIYHFPGTSTYRFYAGVGLDDLRRVVEEDVAGLPRDLEDVANYLQERLSTYMKAQYVEATQFVAEQRLASEDWRFAIRVFTAEKLRELLQRDSVETGSRGLLAVLVSPTANDAQLRAVEFEEELCQSQLKSSVVVCVPKQGLLEVAGLITSLRALQRKSTAEKDRYGEAYGQLVRMWEIDIHNRLEGALQEYVLCSSVADRLPTAERHNIEAVCSRLLSERYGFVAPIESIDKLRSGHRVGAQIVAFMVKQLLNKSLTSQSFPNTSYRTVIDSVFLRSWRVLQLSGKQYSAEVPTNSRVKAAWDAITSALPLSPDKETKITVSELWKQLSREPFGFSDLTFTALLGSWLCVNRAELKIIVVKRLNGQPSQHQEMTVAQFCSNAEPRGPGKVRRCLAEGRHLHCPSQRC